MEDLQKRLALDQNRQKDDIVKQLRQQKADDAAKRLEQLIQERNQYGLYKLRWALNGNSTSGLRSGLRRNWSGSPKGFCRGWSWKSFCAGSILRARTGRDRKGGAPGQGAL